MLVIRVFHPISNIKLCILHHMPHVFERVLDISGDSENGHCYFFEGTMVHIKKNKDITTYDGHNVCQIIRFYTQKDGGSFILRCISATNFKLSFSDLTLRKDIVQTRNDHY